MFDINGWEFVIILVVAVVVIGPERLPTYLAQVRQWIRDLKKLADGATTQLREQMGPEFDDIDWKAYDPRQYDPRRIVRDALAETWNDDGGASAVTPDGAPAMTAPTAVAYDPSRPTPFDTEAT